ncbi:MAG TPA: hypothetical protein PLS77_11135 [Anaerolineaceae bacterium]|jgi:hypothetical protein|nr:hypothetical protein [Anaerolineaceae bacterium]NMD31705.1 hypothetical protein [Chloroflexota bacterium]HNS63297.1 hypothetical protein [Anaerolineaceae bacterium]HNZ01701.1 hypothetical protein [Anaerolineaceae bacterium]HOD43642.1 hypothetical protein [Anaerolineaceae bacterium]
MCYTETMQAHPHWASWAQFLQRWGLKGVAAALLETGGPLNIVAAQLLIAGQPLLGRKQPEPWMALANLLEDPEQARTFATFLREEATE